MAAQSGMKYCVTCGEQIHEKAEICPKCGVRQPTIATSTGGRNRITAALLAIFLGGLGIHKFYLGQMGMGILYLVFSVTTIPLWIGLIEGIILFSMNDADFNAKYNAG